MGDLPAWRIAANSSLEYALGVHHDPRKSHGAASLSKSLALKGCHLELAQVVDERHAIGLQLMRCHPHVAEMAEDLEPQEALARKEKDAPCLAALVLRRCLGAPWLRAQSEVEMAVKPLQSLHVVDGHLFGERRQG